MLWRGQRASVVSRQPSWGLTALQAPPFAQLKGQEQAGNAAGAGEQLQPGNLATLAQQAATAQEQEQEGQQHQSNRRRSSQAQHTVASKQAYKRRKR